MEPSEGLRLLCAYRLLKARLSQSNYPCSVISTEPNNLPHRINAPGLFTAFVFTKNWKFYGFIAVREDINGDYKCAYVLGLGTNYHKVPKHLSDKIFKVLSKIYPKLGMINIRIRPGEVLDPINYLLEGFHLIVGASLLPVNFKYREDITPLLPLYSVGANRQPRSKVCSEDLILPEIPADQGSRYKIFKLWDMGMVPNSRKFDYSCIVCGLGGHCYYVFVNIRIFTIIIPHSFLFPDEDSMAILVSQIISKVEFKLPKPTLSRIITDRTCKDNRILLAQFRTMSVPIRYWYDSDELACILLSGGKDVFDAVCDSKLREKLNISRALDVSDSSCQVLSQSQERKSQVVVPHADDDIIWSGSSFEKVIVEELDKRPIEEIRSGIHQRDGV